MKYILIALLFCNCGSSGEVEPTYFDSHFLGATYYSDKPNWQLSDGALDSGYHIERGLLFNFEVKDKLPIEIVDTVSFVYDAFNNSFIPITMTRLKDTVPKLKTKPLNIKMKPRKQKDTTLTFGKYEDVPSINYDGANLFIFKVTPLQVYDDTENYDTVKVIMLVSDTSPQNGYRTQRCYWMYGYEVQTWGSTSGNFHIAWLDDKKVPLSKNLIVWISKEIK